MVEVDILAAAWWGGVVAAATPLKPLADDGCRLRHCDKNIDKVDVICCFCDLILFMWCICDVDGVFSSPLLGLRLALIRP